MIRKLLMILIALIGCALSASAQETAFLGKWDITGLSPHESYVYWLEVKNDNGQLTGWFLNRGGSVYKLPKLTIEKDELIFPLSDRPDVPINRAKVIDGKLMGSMTVNNQTIKWAGVRPPKWGTYDANGKHRFGQPVELFDGKSMDGWDVQFKNKPSGWSVVDGTMTNEARANNLVSKQTFKDFKIRCEYKLEKGSNSGIYLRGRYELQVLDDYGKEPESHGHMALYSRVAPKMNASKPAGEWQTMEATIIGNRVTVMLNGQLVQDNIVIDGITGGALDSNEGAPGPVMLQGDHGKVWFRKVTVTPIIK